MQFSNTTNNNGIIQQIERTLSFDYGEISGNEERLEAFTADVNNAERDAYAIALENDGTRQADDKSHTDYPIVVTDLYQGQNDYVVVVDDNDVDILNVTGVSIVIDGREHELLPLDQQSPDAIIDTTEGNPTHYDLTANGVFITPAPKENVTGGLLLYIERDATYFTTADTTKTGMLPNLFARYYVIHPCTNYAMIHGLANYKQLMDERIMLEARIAKWYRNRGGIVRGKMRPKIYDTR